MRTSDTMITDNLAMQGTRASAALLLIWLAHNDVVPAPGGLMALDSVMFLIFCHCFIVMFSNVSFICWKRAKYYRNFAQPLLTNPKILGCLYYTIGIHPSISIFRLRCYSCPNLWGWQHQAMSNTGFPWIFVWWVSASQATHFDISLHAFTMISY